MEHLFTVNVAKTAKTLNNRITHLKKVNEARND
jgi:hypothetical protein